MPSLYFSTSTSNLFLSILMLNTTVKQCYMPKKCQQEYAYPSALVHVKWDEFTNSKLWFTRLYITVHLSYVHPSPIMSALMCKTRTRGDKPSIKRWIHKCKRLRRNLRVETQAISNIAKVYCLKILPHLKMMKPWLLHQWQWPLFLLRNLKYLMMPLQCSPILSCSTVYSIS